MASYTITYVDWYRQFWVERFSSRATDVEGVIRDAAKTLALHAIHADIRPGTTIRKVVNPVTDDSEEFACLSLDEYRTLLRHIALEVLERKWSA